MQIQWLHNEMIAVRQGKKKKKQGRESDPHEVGYFFSISTFFSPHWVPCLVQISQPVVSSALLTTILF